MNDAEVQAQDAEEMIAQLNALVEELEHYPDSDVREKALDLVQIILELYGEALRRIIQAVESLPLKDQVVSRLLDDEVIRAILAIHGLLPSALRERVAAALDELRKGLISQGADVELISVEDGVARLRLIRSGKGAPRVEILKSEIEKNLMEAAPDLLGVEVEGLPEGAAAAMAPPDLRSTVAFNLAGQPERPQPQLFQIKRPRPDKSKVTGAWVPIIKAAGLKDGETRAINFSEHNLLACKLNGEFYCYRNQCAAGERALDDALLDGPILTCGCHGYSYDLRRKGACVERPDLRLESLPLIVEDEKVKVAL